MHFKNDQEAAKYHVNLMHNMGLKEALDSYAQYKPSISNEIILTRARLSGLEQNVRLGIISHSDAVINRNQITQAFLSIIGFSGEAEAPSPEKSKIQKNVQELEGIHTTFMFESGFEEIAEQAEEIATQLRQYASNQALDDFYDIEGALETILDAKIKSFYDEHGEKLERFKSIRQSRWVEEAREIIALVNANDFSNAHRRAVTLATDFKSGTELDLVGDIKGCSNIPELKAVFKSLYKAIRG